MLWGKNIQKRNKMAKKGRKDGEAVGAGLGMILFNVHVAQCRDIRKCHSQYYRKFSDSVCIKESKARTPNLIIPCEDANSTGYEQRLKFAR